MQKLWLKDFEHHISQNTSEAAEAFVRQGKVKNLREIEKHFWVALVETDEGNFEAEVIITPHKIKAFACECFAEGRRLICPHITASLLKIRQFLQQKEAERQSRKERKEHAELSRYTVQAALEHVSPEALTEFVREYARSDRDFALALKTKFAGQVTKTDNPFALVLDSVLPKAGTKSKFTEADFRRLNKTAEDLLEQATNALEVSDFRTAFQISSTVYQKLALPIPKLEGSRAAAIHLLAQIAFAQLLEAHDLSPSAALRENVWEFLFRHSLIFPPPAAMTDEVLSFLGNQTSDEVKFAAIREKFDELPHPAPHFLLELFLVALAYRNMPEATVRVLDDYRSWPETIKKAFFRLADLKFLDAAYQIGEKFLDEGIFSPPQSRDVECLLLDIAGRGKDTVRQAKWLRKGFLQSGAPTVLEKLKSVSGERWEQERSALLSELEAKGDVAKTAVLFSTDGDLTALKTFLAQKGDLPMLKRYEKKLLAEDRLFLKEQYVRNLRQYLEEHYGAPASQHVRLQLSDLYQQGETELVSSIIRELSAQFPERSSLPSELAELFPKKKLGGGF
jgi:hypothetical protein